MPLPSLAELGPQIVVALVMLGGAAFMMWTTMKIVERRLAAASTPTSTADASGAQLALTDTGERENPFAKMEAMALVIARLDEELEKRDERERKLNQTLSDMSARLAALETDVKWLRKLLADRRPSLSSPAST